MRAALLGLSRKLAAHRLDSIANLVLKAAERLWPRDPAVLRDSVKFSLQQRRNDAALVYCRRLLAEDPNDDQVRETLATLELASGNIDNARSVLEPFSALPSGKGFRVLEDALIDADRARSVGVYVARLSNVDVETADWSILDGTKVYNNEAHNRGLSKNPFVQGRTNKDQTAFIFKLPAISRSIDTECVYLAGDHNYAHWINRNLFKLALLEGSAEAELPLVINEDLTRYQREYLELLRIDESRLIRVPRPALIRCRLLVVPTSLANHVKMNIGTRWLREKLAAWIEARKPGARLYVSRRDARVRRLLNESELEHALEALGFSAIVPGEMTVREQIRAFSSAEAIVGVHGAAFGNLVFAAPGTPVVEINSTYKAHMPDFAVMASACELKLTTVMSEEYDFSRPQKYWPDTDFRVDVGEVLAALRRIAPTVVA